MAETASLLNVADDTLVDLIGEETFDQSLLLNVLFQKRILIHEAYLFNSTLLARHLAGSHPGASLFECAAKSGLITPAYRTLGCLTAADAYEAMLAEYGRTYPLLHPEMQPFRDRVEAAVDLGVDSGKKPFYWPPNANLGEGYLALLRKMLQTELPPKQEEKSSDRKSHFLTMWEHTKRWRFELVDNAVARTQARGQMGVQRTEIYRLLGVGVGLPYNEKSAPSTAELIERSPDPESRLGMRVFLKWVAQIHHTNQARVFGTAMNFPAYHLDEDFMLDSLLRTPLDTAPLENEGLRCEATLPPLSALIKVGADRLVGIRRDHGDAYLKALERWNGDPTGSENASKLEQALHDYCAAICDRFNKEHLQPVVVEFATRKGLSTDIVAAPSKAFAASLVAGFISSGLQAGSEAFALRAAIATFASMATAGAIALVSFVNRKRKVDAHTPSRRTLELTLPVA
jgi:hypothetical protein